MLAASKCIRWYTATPDMLAPMYTFHISVYNTKGRLYPYLQLSAYAQVTSRPHPGFQPGQHRHGPEGGISLHFLHLKLCVAYVMLLLIGLRVLHFRIVRCYFWQQYGRQTHLLLLSLGRSSDVLYDSLMFDQIQRYRWNRGASMRHSREHIGTCPSLMYNLQRVLLTDNSL